MIDRDVIEILACPSCRSSVREEDGAIVCSTCGRRYPVRDGIPVMIIEESVMPGDAKRTTRGGAS